MLHGEQRDLFELSFAVPSECADQLASGAADLGIVPTVELPRQGLGYLPGTGIGCRGPVRSLLLISKVPLGEIRRLAADTGSRTTVALARILLARRWGAAPEFLPMAPELEPMLASADAALIIGDAALRLDPKTLPYHVADMGEAWVTMTGLPMVFAVWAGRPELMSAELEATFRASCRFGLEHLEDIVRLEAPRRGISEELAREYLTRHTVLELGDRDYEGMRLFLSYAAESGMLESKAGAVSHS